MIGKRFYQLVVLEQVDGTHDRWLCLCDCGSIKEVSGRHLRNNTIKSCGCLRKKNAAFLFTKHGGCTGKREKLYFVWRDIKGRTMNPNHKRYDDYGGRGIQICDEWKNSYDAFRKWSLDNGYNPSLPSGQSTIDRIDVNGNYEPNNCRYITNKEQALNKRTNHYITVNGKVLTISQWADAIGVTRSKLSYLSKLIGDELAVSILIDNPEITVKEAKSLYKTVSCN